MCPLPCGRLFASPSLSPPFRPLHRPHEPSRAVRPALASSIPTSAYPVPTRPHTHCSDRQSCLNMLHMPYVNQVHFQTRRDCYHFSTSPLPLLTNPSSLPPCQLSGRRPALHCGPGLLRRGLQRPQRRRELVHIINIMLRRDTVLQRWVPLQICCVFVCVWCKCV